MSKKEGHKKITVLTMIIRILPQVVSISPGLFTLNYIIFALDGVFDGVTILCIQTLFDRVTDLVTSRGIFKDAVLALIYLFLIKILKEVTSGIANFIGETYDTRVTGKLYHTINLKMGKLDPICFENTELLDDINKSYTGVKYTRNFINTILDIVTTYMPYFIFMTIYLFTLKPILSISLLLIFIPVLLTQFVRTKLYSRLEDDSATLRRVSNYYENCMIGREYLKETRALGACPYFMKLFKATLSTMNNLKWKTGIKVNLIELGTKIISLIGYLGILWMLFNALMNGDITVGAFAAVFASIEGMFNLMEEIICMRLAYCAENFGKVQNYLRFLDIPERIEDINIKEDIVHGDIILENVSFSYPLSEKYAVENISLKIRMGETIAIVGENGSGKSTLVRLITGLYIPQKGSVFHNNKSTKEIEPKYLFSGISGVFQNFQKYQLSLSDNISISNMELELMNQASLECAAAQAGIELDAKIFPDGYDTMISREFNGIDLSGGQWQRVAIARGLYRGHELIVLDEPTSAIDPIEETNIYERFTRIAKSKTAIVVTHRLGSVKFADRVVVMNDGKIVGIGRHDELISSCPIYVEMWKSQAQYYTNSDILET